MNIIDKKQEVKYGDFRLFLYSNYTNINIVVKNYIELLSKLTIAIELTNEKFLEQLDNIYKTGVIYIAYTGLTIVGSGTIFIEPKIIRGGMNVGHIEDIVVDDKFRNIGISTNILDYLKKYAFIKNCYKVILDCDKTISKVYEKSEFIQNGVQMTIYF